MKTFILRILLSAFYLAAALTVGAQVPVKPLIQTSAEPEETAVWKPSGKPTSKPVAHKQKNTLVKQSARKKSAGKNPVVEKAKKTAVPVTGNRYHTLKTNVAFDAIGVLNLAYEVQLHRKMTLDLPVMWSLWDAQREHALRVIASQPAALEVTHDAVPVVFSLGADNPQIGGTPYMRRYASSSVLYDEIDGVWQVQEAVDKTPVMTRNR